MAIFSSSGKIPVFNTWFVNIVNDLIIAVSIIFINFEEIRSNPQLFFVGRLYSFLYSFLINILKFKYRMYVFI